MGPFAIIYEADWETNGLTPYNPRMPLKWFDADNLEGWVCHEKQESNQMFRNCINDGRRPTAHALQQECTNRLKVLCSKDKVLSVWVKRCRKASGKCNGVECK